MSAKRRVNIEWFIEYYRSSIKNARARANRCHVGTMKYAIEMHALRFYKGELVRALRVREKSVQSERVRPLATLGKK